MNATAVMPSVSDASTPAALAAVAATSRMRSASAGPSDEADFAYSTTARFTCGQ
jgi:hypothetical protein